MLFGSYIAHAVVPKFLVFFMTFKRLHFKRFHTLLARTYVHTVAAAQAVEHIHHLHKFQSLQALADSRKQIFGLERRTGSFFFVEQERTNCCVRTNVSTFVTLDTVGCIPNRNEVAYAAFFVSGSTVLPRTIFNALECAHRKQVAILSIDGANEVAYKFGSIVFYGIFNSEVRPCRVNGELFVFTTAVHCLIVLVDDVFAFASIRFHNECFHLLHSKVHRYHFGNTEECRLQNSVCAITQTNFHGNLGGIDVVYGDIVVGKVFLHAVGQIIGKLFAIPNGIQQECAVLLQAASHVVHVQISLHVACHEVWRGHQIGGADGLVAEAEV